MKILLATLCLNEIEWLPLLYQQHKDWPGLCGWVFVESADRIYAEANPTLISNSDTPGLSVDGTTEFLQSLASQDSLIHYIPHGISSHSNPAQGKCESRNRYLERADTIRPDAIIVLDADEFYSYKHQVMLTALAARHMTSLYKGVQYRQRHIWYPPGLAATRSPNDTWYQKLAYEVTGAYWNVPHTRLWIYEEGMRYKDNHNTPTYGEGLPPIHKLFHPTRDPYCVHMGFASSLSSRCAKHAYYKARGEGVYDRRQMYVDCRAAYETWTPGKALPHGAEIIGYTGIIPECFHTSRTSYIKANTNE